MQGIVIKKSVQFVVGKYLLVFVNNGCYGVVVGVGVRGDNDVGVVFVGLSNGQIDGVGFFGVWEGYSWEIWVWIELFGYFDKFG